MTPPDDVVVNAGRRAAHGLTTLPEESVMLVDTQDLDPPEVTALDIAAAWHPAGSRP